MENDIYKKNKYNIKQYKCVHSHYDDMNSFDSFCLVQIMLRYRTIVRIHLTQQANTHTHTITNMLNI